MRCIPVYILNFVAVQRLGLECISLRMQIIHCIGNMIYVNNERQNHLIIPTHCTFLFPIPTMSLFFYNSLYSHSNPRPSTIQRWNIGPKKDLTCWPMEARDGQHLAFQSFKVEEDVSCFCRDTIYMRSPAAAFIWPYFLRRMAETVMKPVVSAGEKSPISSMEDSLMS
jgi:hypothetical protein